MSYVPHTKTLVVKQTDTANAFGDDFPAAASTPAVLGLAEVACHEALSPTLEAGQITVGTRAVIDHLAPSPVGATLVATVTHVQRQGRRVDFVVEVNDEDGPCARIEHTRAVVVRAAIEKRLNVRLGTTDHG
jgi:fluoroacetyl-CoA thioesterase